MTESNSSSRDRGDWGADPELRALMRSGDPAHSLPPLTAVETARLVSQTVEADPAPLADSVPLADDASSRRSGVLMPLLVAAAAAMVIAGVSFVTAGTDAPTAPTAGPTVISSDPPSTPAPPAPPTQAPAPPAPAPDPPSSAPPASTVLVVPDASTLKCMVPNVEVLRLQEVAFAGTVTAMQGADVTISPGTVYRGDVSETVQVQAPSAQMSALLSAVSFEVGKTYLVSASDGQVTLCGFSAEDNPTLRALYEQAFAG